MKIPAPFLTLAAGAVTGGVLLTMSHAAAGTADRATSRASGAARPAAAPAAAPAAPAPSTAPPARAVEPAAGPPAETAAPAPAPTGAAAAAGSDDAGLSGYAGRIPDSRLALQLAVRDGRAVAYVCDGDTVEAWLRGDLDGRTLRLTGPDGDRLTATLTTGRAQVRLTAFGRSWSFPVSAVDPASVPAVTKKLAP